MIMLNTNVYIIKKYHTFFTFHVKQGELLHFISYICTRSQAHTHFVYNKWE